MPTATPRDRALESTLAFLSEGYDFIARRCERLGSDIFRARLLGRTFHFVRGAEAARMFYTPGRFTRRGALPVSVLHLLQDKGSVATLDGEAHRHRKQMFMSLMAPAQVEAMARMAAEGLRTRSRSWPAGTPIRLHEELRAVLVGAACAWAGVPLEEAQLRLLTREIGAMIDNAGRFGPPNWFARIRRWHAEALMRRVVADLRAGRTTAPEGSAARVIALHKGLDGALLPPSIAAIELLNILRPTAAIARFGVFAALALHRHPEARQKLAEDDAYLEAFVQEVRRLSPFFPAVTGIARTGFTWRDHNFHEGDRFILDLYGTNRDPRIWPDADSFRPERFLGWQGDPFTLIPQGGGDHHADHRCAGEWVTIAVMKAMLRVLARDIAYEVPPQDLAVPLTQLPSLPRSGFVILRRDAP